MRNNRFIQLLPFLLIAVFAFIYVKAWACSCREVTVEQGVENADVVFIGKVMEREEVQRYNALFQRSFSAFEYKMSVSRVFKGTLAMDTITVVSGLGSGDCGYRFRLGSTYIIYAYYDKDLSSEEALKEKVLTTNICTRTRRKDFREIRAIKKYLRSSKHEKH